MKSILLTIVLSTAVHSVHADPAAPDIDKSVSVEDRTVGGDSMKRYFLIRHKPDSEKAPKEYGLLLILPGGPGSADFLTFCANTLTLYGTPKDIMVAELVAPVWNAAEAENLVWPGGEGPLKSKFAKFTTEQFMDAVIDDVGKSNKIHPGWVFSLGWSSSGHVLYSSSFDNPKIRGSFIAMSRFKADWFARPENAKGKRYYFWHSPDDQICSFAEAQAASAFLTKQGASTILKTYPGGHGWRPYTFYCDRLIEAIEWFRASDADAVKMKAKIESQ